VRVWSIAINSRGQVSFFGARSGILPFLLPEDPVVDRPFHDWRRRICASPAASGPGGGQRAIPGTAAPVIVGLRRNPRLPKRLARATRAELPDFGSAWTGSIDASSRALSLVPRHELRRWPFRAGRAVSGPHALVLKAALLPDHGGRKTPRPFLLTLPPIRSACTRLAGIVSQRVFSAAFAHQAISSTLGIAKHRSWQTTPLGDRPHRRTDSITAAKARSAARAIPFAKKAPFAFDREPVDTSGGLASYANNDGV